MQGRSSSHRQTYLRTTPTHLEVCLLGDSKSSQVDDEGQYLEVVDSVGKGDHLIHLGEKVDGK